VGNSTVFHYSTHAVVLNYRMEAESKHNLFSLWD